MVVREEQMSDYVTRILGNLGDRPPIDSLRESRRDIEATVTSIGSKDAFDVAYAEGKWTAREVICHLADVEVALGFRMRQVIAVDNVVIQPFDEQAWATGYKAADPRLALQSFLSLRAWNLAFLDALPASAWDRPYRHPEQGDLKFRVLIKLLAGHDINHLRQLQTIEAGRESTPFDRMSSLIGVIQDGPPNLAERTGRKFAALLTAARTAKSAQPAAAKRVPTRRRVH